MSCILFSDSLIQGNTLLSPEPHILKVDIYYDSIENKQKNPPTISQFEKLEDYFFHLTMPNEKMLIVSCVSHVITPISKLSGNKHDFGTKNMPIISIYPAFSSLIFPGIGTTDV